MTNGNGTNGHGTGMVVKPQAGVSVVNVGDWLTRREVARALRCTVSSVRQKYEKKGLLHPQCDADGVWRFNPFEVEQVADDEGIEGDAVESRANAYARVDLQNSQRLIRLVTDPLERIQRYSSDIIDRQSVRIKELEAMLDASRAAREAAEDKTTERETLSAIFKEREKRITDLLGRAMVHVDKFLNGGGTPFLHSLTEGQMAMMLAVKDDFTPEQREAIDAACAKLGFKFGDKPEGESQP